MSPPTRPLGTLLLTHSSRRVNPERCSVDFLTRRFSDPDRLRDLPPFETLPPARALYSGALSVWRVGRDGRDGTLRVRRLGSVRSRDKIQHAALASDTELLIGFEHRLERWRLAAPIDALDRLDRGAMRPEATLVHPHLAGLHTVEPLPGGRAAVSCSAPDAVLVVDLATGTVERTLRMAAELYGAGYELRADRDLVRHFIDDGHQATHLNAAHRDPEGRRLAVSTLIQGAVGVFDLATGGYRELTRGFVGCHGARFDRRGEVYFTDSVTGCLVRLDRRGRVAGRFAVGSRWLHDALEIGDGLVAFALSDANELRLVDVGRGRVLWRRRFARWPVDALFGAARRWPGWLGNSTQALSFRPAAAE